MLLGVPFLPTISDSSWSSNKFENTFLHLFFALFYGYIAVGLISIGIGIVITLNEVIKYIFSFNLVPHSFYNYSLPILGTAFAIGVVLAAIQDARKENKH